VKRLLLSAAYRLYKLRWRIFRPVTIGVRLLLVDGERVVLVKHTYQPGWQLPGGALNRWETPAAAAVREGVEEAGAQVLDGLVLLGIYSSFDDGQSNHIMTYFCRSYRLEPRSDRWEIAECREFALDALPPDMTAGTRRRIEEYLAGVWPLQRPW
jgi:8-oxo-dGTP pyrophosphatase MutT (NUDIX family)